VEHLPQRFRDLVETRRVKLALADIEKHRHLVIAGAKRGHQQHFGEDDSEREEIRAPVHLLGVRRLGAEVPHFPLDDPVLGVLLAVARTGDAEVGQLDLAVVGDDDVPGADVAVDDLLRLPVRRPKLVRELEAGADIGDDLCGQAPGTSSIERTEALQHPKDVAARNILHRDVRQSVGLAKVENLDDVGVDQPRRDLRLVGEHAKKSGTFEQVGMNSLDGDGLGKPADSHHLRPKDVGHPPGGDLVDQNVLPKSFHGHGPPV